MHKMLRTLLRDSFSSSFIERFVSCCCVISNVDTFCLLIGSLYCNFESSLVNLEINSYSNSPSFFFCFQNVFEHILRRWDSIFRFDHGLFWVTNTWSPGRNSDITSSLSFSFLENTISISLVSYISIEHCVLMLLKRRNELIYTDPLFTYPFVFRDTR